MSVSASAPIHTLLQCQGYSQYSSYSVCPTASHLPRARPQPSKYVLHAVPCHLKRTPHFHATQVPSSLPVVLIIILHLSPHYPHEKIFPQKPHTPSSRRGRASPGPCPAHCSSLSPLRTSLGPLRTPPGPLSTQSSHRLTFTLNHTQAIRREWGIISRTYTPAGPARRRSAGAQAK